MNLEEKSIHKFFKEVSVTLEGAKEMNTSALDSIPLNSKECMYLLDFSQNKVVYHRGFDNVIDYDDNDISLEFLLNNYHPDDSEILNRLSKATILYLMENPLNAKNSELFISYRRRKRDGTYIKVLSKGTIFNVDDQGIINRGLVIMVDVSFLDNSEVVKWSFKADNMNKEAFKNKVYKAYKDFFTTRELDIITQIAKNLTNKEIAEKLNISQHTVATHRKNIFKKANRNNTKDLLLFCRKKGII